MLCRVAYRSDYIDRAESASALVSGEGGGSYRSISEIARSAGIHVRQLRARDRPGADLHQFGLFGEVRGTDASWKRFLKPAVEWSRCRKVR